MYFFYKTICFCNENNTELKVTKVRLCDWKIMFFLLVVNNISTFAFLNRRLTFIWVCVFKLPACKIRPLLFWTFQFNNIFLFFSYSYHLSSVISLSLYLFFLLLLLFLIYFLLFIFFYHYHYCIYSLSVSEIHQVTFLKKNNLKPTLLQLQQWSN